jgi:hypothetical protein
MFELEVSLEDGILVSAVLAAPGDISFFLVGACFQGCCPGYPEKSLASSKCTGGDKSGQLKR